MFRNPAVASDRSWNPGVDGSVHGATGVGHTPGTSVDVIFTIFPPVNWIRSNCEKYTLPSSSTQHPAKLSNTENATPNPPPTCTGKPVGDSIPGGAVAPLTMSATGNASTPLR